MVGKSPADGGGGGSPRRLANGLLETMAYFWAMCAKRASRVSRRLASSPRASPLIRPKQLLVSISNKAIGFRRKEKVGGALEEEEEGGFGDGGLWQRDILMGDKCQPLDFSGVIYYDSSGKRLSELPVRSPRASPLPRYAYSVAGEK